MQVGSKTSPIRVSSIPMLLACPGFHVMRQLYPEDGGAAADIGTAVGRACELFHHGSPPQEAIRKALGEVPGADGTAVELMVLGYCRDPRNGPMSSMPVVPSSQEEELVGEIDGIHFTGHMDQIRQHEDGLRVWDLKAGSMYGGSQMTNVYAAQLALYSKLATMRYGEPVGVGGIVRMRGYSTKEAQKMVPGTQPVFFECGWSPDTVEFLLERVLAEIRRLRRDYISIAPGGHCSYCPGQGVAGCLPVLRSRMRAK